MNATPSLRFGRCELHLLRREVTLDGTTQAVAPKAFDLLVLLVQHRERVLPKEELSATLWPGEVLSDSVIARTVMKARRAIGDSASAPQWIRSVHGFGYRFVGGLRDDAEPAAAESTTWALPPPGGRRVSRIGVLPCVNESGEARLDWAQIGLMSLVTHALDHDARLTTVPVTTMLEALPRGDDAVKAVPAARQAQIALEALGLDHVVHGVLRRRGGALWLDYHVFGPHELAVGGSVCDADPLILGERLAEAVAAVLFPGELADTRFVSRDPFVNQAFARAVESMAREEYAAATPLLAVIRGLEPDSLVVQLWQARCLVLMRDPSAQPAAEALLARAVTAADERTQAMAHVLIVIALQAQTGPAVDAALRTHAEAAERLARGREREDWFGWLLFHLGRHAHGRGDLSAAAALYGRAEAVCRSSGNAFQLSVARQSLALIDVGTGDLIRARERLDAALRSHRRAQRHKSAAHALGWLAAVNAGLGLLDVAFTQCDEVLSLLGPLHGPGWEGLPLSAVALVYAERAATAKVERVLAAFEGVADASDPLLRGPWLAVRGTLALCHGNHAMARVLLNEAIAEGRAGPGATVVRAWSILLLRLELADANFTAVAGLRERLTANPALAAVPELRGVLLHAQAAEHHHHGDQGAVTRLLGDIVEQVPLGRENACARFDAAWLCLERGDTERAEHLMASVNAWRQEHPVGLATQARLLFALGDAAGAAAAQRFALDRQQGRAPAWHHEALVAYRAAMNGDSVLLRPLPRLVSDSWLPPADPAPALAGARVAALSARQT